MSGSFARPQGIVCLLLILLAGSVHAQTETLQAGGLVLHAEIALLEMPGGRTLRLDVPPRAELSSLAETGRGWIVAGSAPGEGSRRGLFLLTAEGPLPAPPGQQGIERREAVLLVENGTLAGLAWLEGNGGRSLSVRAAAWNGHAWQAVEPVSRPGPGSQLALSGAVLADGSWLLAWSAFDGNDDEIVWARRTAAGWSPARPVSKDNSVPDITPAVAAHGNGALIAWSRYDGESYRLHMARLAGNTWQDECPAAATGSIYPSFLRAADGLYLLHLNAFPRAWSVLEIGPSGRVLRRATSLSALAERPVLGGLGEDAQGGVRLRWPSGKREAAAAWEKSP
ncbi:MAG TPA: hypothetical protein VN493_04800 [Thermoanaerobaculia bacterium]|nr:hypothetical protein [Thermoanaerobaculia bacterium]